MANELKGKRVAFLFTDGAEQSEVTAPLDAVRKAGADTEIISLEKGDVEMWKHFDKGDKITADKAVADADPSDYDGLVLPGGVANPDQLRANKDAVKFVRTFFDKPQARRPAGVLREGDRGDRVAPVRVRTGCPCAAIPWLLAAGSGARHPGGTRTYAAVAGVAGRSSAPTARTPCAGADRGSIPRRPRDLHNTSIQPSPGDRDDSSMWGTRYTTRSRRSSATVVLRMLRPHRAATFRPSAPFRAPARFPQAPPFPAPADPPGGHQPVPAGAKNFPLLKYLLVVCLHA